MPLCLFAVGTCREGLSPGFRPSNERPGLRSRLDDRVSQARHRGGERRYRLAAAIGIVRVPSAMSPKPVVEAVVALLRGDWGGHPEGPAQSCVAVLG